MTIRASAETLVTYNLGTSTDAIVSGSFTSQLNATGIEPHFAGSFGNAFGFSSQTPKNYYIKFPGMTQTIVSGTSYMDFTVSPQAQTTFDLNELVFNIGISAQGAMSATATLFSSLDNYEIALGNIVLTATGSQGSTYQNWTVTLPDSFDAITDDLSFRLYINKTTGAQSEANNIVRLTGFTLDGLVVVPEPSTLMLLGAGAGLLFFLRRRK